MAWGLEPELSDHKACGHGVLCRLHHPDEKQNQTLIVHIRKEKPKERGSVTCLKSLSKLALEAGLEPGVHDTWCSALLSEASWRCLGRLHELGWGHGVQHSTAGKSQALEPSAYHSSATWKLCDLEQVTSPLCALVSSLGVTMAPTS